MPSTFSDLGLPQTVVSSLAARGISEAFPIQTLAIPPALAGRDVCGRAPTGSGKTLAFGIPLAERVGDARPRRPRALVLAPTRELAKQITDELRLLLAPHGRTVHAFYGGVGFGPQTTALRKGVDVAVACPGRLADLIGRRDLRLDEVEVVVIDEADRMADMGFLPEVRRILDQVRPDRQTLLFSATLDGDVDVLIRHYQRDPERCEIAPDDDHVDLTAHHFVRTSRERRIAETAGFVAEHGPTVVFCRTKHGADRVARQLSRAGVDAVPIHGGRSQNQRHRALAAFTNGKAQALVATDVAARGIHVDDVACVVHFDPPGDHKDYVHRSGRTGRAGATGVVITFVTDQDREKVRILRRDLDRAGVDISDATSGQRSDGDATTGDRAGAASARGEAAGSGPDRTRPAGQARKPKAKGKGRPSNRDRSEREDRDRPSTGPARKPKPKSGKRSPAGKSKANKKNRSSSGSSASSAGRDGGSHRSGSKPKGKGGSATGSTRGRGPGRSGRARQQAKAAR